VKSSKDEEEYYEEGATADDQYDKDNKMQRVKIKKRRAAGQRLQRANYESPY